MSRSGSDRQFIVVLVAAVMALVGVAFIISNLSYLDLGDGYESLAPAVNSVTSSVVYLLLAIWLCVIIYLVYFFSRAKRTGGPRASGKPASPFSMIVVVGIVLALIVIVALSGGRLTPPNLIFSNPGTDGGGGTGAGEPSGTGSTSILLVVFIALVVMGLVLGTRYFRNRPFRESTAFQRIEQDQANLIIQQAMKALYEGQDTRAVIVRTYQQMCRLVGGAALGSAPYLTPHEFALLAVQRLNWPEGPVLKLTELFEEAWYSEHQLDEDKKQEALNCLEQLKSSRENLGNGKGSYEPAIEA